ncbi:type IV secretory system conjugative DNA transfer family protein [Adonisia turfae]|nr:type IV secretion system DNA-binding domain-containing protein [Adonisia turfae]
MNTSMASAIHHAKVILDTRLGRIAAGFVCGGAWSISAMLFIPPSDALLLFGVALIISFSEILIYEATFKAYPRSGRNNSHRQFWQNFLLWRCLPSWGLLFFLNYFGLFLIVVIAILKANAHLRTRPSEILLEGQQVSETAEAVQRDFDLVRAEDDPGFPFGGTLMSQTDADKHILFVAATGAGKSVLMKHLLFYLLANWGTGYPERFLIHDPAGEFPATLEALGLAEHVIYTDPFDQRGRPIDFASMIRTPADIQTFAEILVPQQPGNKGDEFWRNVTILVVKVVVRYFCKSAPGTWTLRDLLNALRHPTLVDGMIADSSELSHYAAYKGSDNTTANILATIVTTMDQYEVLAALYHKLETVYGNKPFDPQRDFLDSNAILLLSSSETAKQAVQNANRILLTRLIQLMLDGPEQDGPTTWFFLDELPAIGRIPSLMAGMTRLRKYGGAFVSVIQTVTQLFEVYGRDESNSILSQYQHVSALHMDDPETAKRFAESAGKVRLLRHTQSYTRNHQSGDSTTYSQQYEEQDVIRPGTFSELPLFNPKQGGHLEGMFFSGNKRWKHSYPASIVEQMPPKGDPSRNKLRMPTEYQFLDPWTEEDYKRLNIEHLMRSDPEIDIDGLLS